MSWAVTAPIHVVVDNRGGFPWGILISTVVPVISTAIGAFVGHRVGRSRERELEARNQSQARRRDLDARMTRLREFEAWITDRILHCDQAESDPERHMPILALRELETAARDTAIPSGSLIPVQSAVFELEHTLAVLGAAGGSGSIRNRIVALRQGLARLLEVVQGQRTALEGQLRDLPS